MTTQTIIHNRKTPLSYWFNNNNFYGTPKDIIGFSWNNYFTFETKKDAQCFIKKMFNDYRKMEGDLKLSLKIFKTLEHLKIKEIIK